MELAKTRDMVDLTILISAEFLVQLITWRTFAVMQLYNIPFLPKGNHSHNRLMIGKMKIFPAELKLHPTFYGENIS